MKINQGNRSPYSNGLTNLFPNFLKISDRLHIVPSVVNGLPHVFLAFSFLCRHSSIEDIRSLY